MGKSYKPSYRHHYVPQFYLNYFKTEEGCLQGFNKDTKEYFPTYTGDVFIGKNRNTFLDENNNESRWIEEVYSRLESKFAIALRNFNTTGKLSSEDVRFLLLFAYTTKWRSPAYDESFEIAKKEMTFADLRLHAVNRFLGIEYDLEQTWDSEEMQASKRILLAIQPFLYKDDYKDISRNLILIATPEPYNAILGDCPFIENPANPNVPFESFIMPLTPDYSMVYLHNKDVKVFATHLDKNFESYIPVIANLRDVSAFHISRKIVVSNSKNRLQNIASMYNQFLASGFDTRKLPGYLFQTLIDKDFLDFLSSQIFHRS